MNFSHKRVLRMLSLLTRGPPDYRNARKRSRKKQADQRAKPVRRKTFKRHGAQWWSLNQMSEGELQDGSHNPQLSASKPASKLFIKADDQIESHIQGTTCMDMCSHY